MIIAVGSENRTKVEAVRQVVLEYDFLKDAEVVAVTVDPQVPEQPLRLEDILRGAMIRAFDAFHNLRKKGTAFQNCSYGIGIESGLVPLPHIFEFRELTGYGRYEERTYCVIYDGTDSKGDLFIGSSAGFEHSSPILDRIQREGIDVSEAYRRAGLTTATKIGEREGCIHLLTYGKMNRIELNKQALRMAILQLENPELYKSS